MLRRVDLTRIQKYFTFSLFAAVAVVVAVLTYLTINSDSSDHWRRDREALLISLLNESEEFLRKHELEIIVRVQQNAIDGNRQGKIRMSDEWIFPEHDGDNNHPGSVEFQYEDSGAIFYGYAVPQRLIDMVGAGTDHLGGTVFVSDSAGSFVAHSNPELVGQQIPDWMNLEATGTEESWTLIESPEGRLVRSVLVSPELWHVGYQDNFRNMNRGERPVLIFNLTVLILLLTVVPFFLYLIRRDLLTPLKILSFQARTFADGTAVLMADRYNIKEIDELAISINTMMDAVNNREESLRLLNETLEEKVSLRTIAHHEALEILQDARNQLQLGDKMAALGSLVSGVAHEINTPISIGITAASFLTERSNSLYKDWETRDLTQENLERFLKDSGEASGIIQSNLDHAARILNSLKQVAIDQQLDDAREFELGSYIKDIVLSLKHQLKQGRHQINTDSGGFIMVNTFPGSITQILNNLVFNSITHGFDGKDSGRIGISTREEGDEVIMIYTDDGRGLTKEEYNKIFDLHFTTRRFAGGSGLGMNIVYKQVTEKLKGQIDITAPPGGGAGFTIRFPKNIGGE